MTSRPARPVKIPCETRNIELVLNFSVLQGKVTGQAFFSAAVYDAVLTASVDAADANGHAVDDDDDDGDGVGHADVVTACCARESPRGQYCK